METEGGGSVSLGRGAWVVWDEAIRAVPIPGLKGSVRIPIDRSTGSRHLSQRVLRLEPSRLAPLLHPAAEEVLYVAEGSGFLEAGKDRFNLEPGTGALVPPGAEYRVSNPGPGDLLLVSVVSPPPSPSPGGTDLRLRSRSRSTPSGTVRTVREEDESPLPAGDDRSFKVLIDARFRCRNVTQFVGYIRESKAPPHVHTYEEAIYILEGNGLVHIGEHHVPIRSGTSIFLPPGTPHCLENHGPGILRLLGVFSPQGSPADKREG
jgi:mannose-6-phosphate isomerase-like protein (cupin superfamily)